MLWSWNGLYEMFSLSGALKRLFSWGCKSDLHIYYPERLKNRWIVIFFLLRSLYSTPSTYLGGRCFFSSFLRLKPKAFLQQKHSQNVMRVIFNKAIYSKYILPTSYVLCWALLIKNGQKCLVNDLLNFTKSILRSFHFFDCS